jgi:hypothetical protein
MHHAAGRQTLALAFGGDEQDYADPELDQATTKVCESTMAAVNAAAAAVPASDWVARRTAMTEELIAQFQLDYGARYLRLKQDGYGQSNPSAELPLCNLPDHMQPFFRAALKRAAAAGDSASGEHGSSGADAGYTGDDSDTDSCDDSNSDSGTDDNDDRDENDEHDEN